MAIITPTKQATQIANPLALPRTLLKPNESEGKMRIKYFEYTPTAAVAAGQIIAFANLPKGSRIVMGRVTSNGLVATADLDIGLAASDLSGVIDDDTAAADDGDMFANDLDVATAGEYSFANTQALNFGYELKKDCVLIGTLATAGMDGAGDSLQGFVMYVLD